MSRGSQPKPEGTINSFAESFPALRLLRVWNRA
jgi:hypothetical protein